jgi:hypothetical protein
MVSTSHTGLISQKRSFKNDEDGKNVKAEDPQTPSKGNVRFGFSSHVSSVLHQSPLKLEIQSGNQRGKGRCKSLEKAIHGGRSDVDRATQGKGQKMGVAPALLHKGAHA